MLIEFIVPASPVPQPRQQHRGFRTKDDSIRVHNYTPRNHAVNAFKATVRMAFRAAYGGPPIQGPVHVDATFIFPRPKRLFWKTKLMPREPHSIKPDRDNCDKALLDALKGLAFVDDSQAYAGMIEKWIAAGDEQPHVKVRISTP